MPNSTVSAESLIAALKQQVHARLASNPPPVRRLAAAGLLPNARAKRGLIDVEKLTVVILHDDVLWDQFAGTRVVGFKAQQIPFGVSWGGVQGTCFEKDLTLAPQAEAGGRRIDPFASRAVLELALRLDRKLDDCSGRSRVARERLRLPPMWAGFRLADEATVKGEGPEFEGACHRHGQSSQELLRDVRREHFGLVLFPLDWVSHQWERFVAVYADLRSFPRTQVFGMRDPATDLTGYRGACQFDFYRSCFRQRRRLTGKRNGRAAQKTTDRTVCPT